MVSMFDLLAASLFAATVGMYCLRRRHESPLLLPYLLILLASAAGDWLGDHGPPALAVGMLIAGAFLLLHIVSLPYSEKGGEGPNTKVR